MDDTLMIARCCPSIFYTQVSTSETSKPRQIKLILSPLTKTISVLLSPCFVFISWLWSFPLSIKPTLFCHGLHQPIILLLYNFNSVVLSAPFFLTSNLSYPMSRLNSSKFSSHHIWNLSTLFIPHCHSFTSPLKYDEVTIGSDCQTIAFLILIVLSTASKIAKHVDYAAAYDPFHLPRKSEVGAF